MPQQANPSPYATPPRRKPGQKGYQPTDKDRATVKALIGYGSTQDETAAVLGISDVTLRKYFEREIQLAVIESNAAVAQSLFKMATRGNNVAAAIFWLKVRAGWKDPLIHEIDARTTYVIRAPTPIESAEQWLRLHGPSPSRNQSDDPLHSSTIEGKLMND